MASGIRVTHVKHNTVNGAVKDRYIFPLQSAPPLYQRITGHPANPPGDGLVMIINVGVNSFAGKLSMSSRGAPSDTPLQVKLGWLAEMIGKLGLAAATVTFVVPRGLFNCGFIPRPSLSSD